jgi:hypothetical protein
MPSPFRPVRSSCKGCQRHERFLALAFEPSYETLDWLARHAEGTHRVHEVGIFDKVKVLEFMPRIPAENAGGVDRP